MLVVDSKLRQLSLASTLGNGQDIHTILAVREEDEFACRKIRTVVLPVPVSLHYRTWLNNVKSTKFQNVVIEFTYVGLPEI